MLYQPVLKLTIVARSVVQMTDLRESRLANRAMYLRLSIETLTLSVLGVYSVTGLTASNQQLFADLHSTSRRIVYMGHGVCRSGLEHATVRSDQWNYSGGQRVS